MFDGNGNWTSDFSAQADRDNGIKILASRFDNIFIADIKESFENCLTKDGQIAPIGNFNMGGQKITNLNNGVNDNDAVNMSQLNTKVGLTGDETISGSKTFTGDGWITKIQNTDVTYNIAPSSVKGTSIVFTDKNGTQMGCIETMRFQSNNTLVRFNAYSPNGNWASQALELMVDANGNTTAFAPASDMYNSIVTTEGINKSPNGYVKLGNGLIIQWGKTPNIGNAGTTCTLPTPFTTTNYSVTAITSSAFNENSIGLIGKTTTNFTLVERGLNGGAHNVPNYFLAIGY